MKGSPAADILLAGAARLEITPQMPVSMGGYGQRAGLLSQGVHDPLYAKALYLQQGEERLLLISTDLVEVPTPIVQRLAPRLEAAGAIAENGLCLTASHTHSGPDVDESLVITAPNRAYLRWLEERLFQVGQAAAAQPVPARLRTAVGQVDFLFNRRQRNAPEKVDPRTLAVLIENRQSGQPLAVLFGVGCHAVCLGHDNLLISADYPGVAQRCLEDALPPAVALFVNLAEGNQLPNTRPSYDSLDTRGYLGGTFADAEKIGAALAQEVLNSLSTAPLEEAARLRVRKRRLLARPAHGDLSLGAALRGLWRERRVILEYLPAFRRASPFNLQPVFTLWRDASQVVIERNLSEAEMRRLMSAVARFLVLAMRLSNPAYRRPLSLPVQTIELGQLRLLTLPGEVLMEVSCDWQQRNAPYSQQAFVIGLANGFLGYLPHPQNFQEPEAEFKYETIMNALEPAAMRLALEQAEKMLKEEADGAA